MPDDAAHAPRGHLHAVKSHRHGHADEVHRVVGVVLRHFGVVVIFGAQPEQARAHVFGELVADGDARAVGVEDRGAYAGEGRLDVGLEAHADLDVGLGNDPVHIAVADLDFLAVRAEGGAFGGLAPVLVADFEEHHTLQGFRSDHVDLGTQAGSGTHLIVAVMLFKITVGERYTVLPQARHLEVDRLRGGSCAKNQTGGQQKRHQSLHLPLSFGLNVLRVWETRHSLSSGGSPPASLMCNPFPMGDQNAGLRMNFKRYMAMGVAMMTAVNTQTMGYPCSGANGMDSVTGRKVRQEKTFIRPPSTATGVS